MSPLSSQRPSHSEFSSVVDPRARSHQRGGTTLLHHAKTTPIAYGRAEQTRDPQSEVRSRHSPARLSHRCQTAATRRDGRPRSHVRPAPPARHPLLGALGTAAQLDLRQASRRVLSMGSSPDPHRRPVCRHRPAPRRRRRPRPRLLPRPQRLRGPHSTGVHPYHMGCGTVGRGRRRARRRRVR